MTHEDSERSGSPEASRFHHAIRILEEFDCAEVRGVARGLLSLTEREHCFLGTYYRAALIVSSLVVLNDPRHFQAIAQLARTLLELAVDIRLINVVPDSVEKMIAFAQWERLKSAREAVSVGDSADHPHDLAAKFIESNEQDITERRNQLWAGVKRLDHWSAMDLRQRVQTLQGSHEKMYRLNYRRLSWYVHPGLTGVLNFESSAFEAVTAVALQVAAEAYEDVLKVIIVELQLSKVDDKIHKKLDVARKLAFTDSPEQASALWGEHVR